MVERDETAWTYIADDQRQQISGANDLVIARYQYLFIDTGGLPDVLDTEEEIREYRNRMLEAAPRCAVAIDGFLRGISVSEYLRNLLTARSMQSANKDNK